jgi:hypothetical protein
MRYYVLVRVLTAAIGALLVLAFIIGLLGLMRRLP